MLTPDESAFVDEMRAYLAERGLAVIAADELANLRSAPAPRRRAARSTEPKPLTATAVRKLRKAHPLEHRAESVYGCPLCAFRADVRTHRTHTTKAQACRFCAYEDAARIFPSYLRRLPDQARYSKTYRAMQHARRHYGAGRVQEGYGVRPASISAHPRLAALQAKLAELARWSAMTDGAAA